MGGLEPTSDRALEAILSARVRRGTRQFKLLSETALSVRDTGRCTRFDVVIIRLDSIGSDPANYSARAHSREQRCRTLLPPNGPVQMQAETPFYNPEQLKAVLEFFCRLIRQLSQPFSRPCFQPMRGECWPWCAAGKSHGGVRPAVKTLQKRFSDIAVTHQLLYTGDSQTYFAAFLDDIQPRSLRGNRPRQEHAPKKSQIRGPYYRSHSMSRDVSDPWVVSQTATRQEWCCSAVHR